VKVDYHPLFQSDLNQAALFYLRGGGRDLAERFIDEVEQALFWIAKNPVACSIVFKKRSTPSFETIQVLRHSL
jgi:hypothetical protein